MPLDDLTDAERACLRAALDHRTAKSVAAALGRSQKSVEHLWSSARRKLGTTSTFEAARLLAHAESRGNSPWEISPVGDDGFASASMVHQPSHGSDDVTALREERSPFSGAPLERSDYPLLDLLHRPNRLSTPARLLVIAVAAAIVIVGLALAPVVWRGMQDWADMYVIKNQS